MRNNGRRRRVGLASNTRAIEKVLERPDATDEEIAAAALPSNGLAVSAEAPVVSPAPADGHLVQAVYELVQRVNQIEARLDARMAGLEQAAANFMAQGNVARETLERHTRVSAATLANETMKALGAEEVMGDDGNGNIVVDPDATAAKYIVDVKETATEWEDWLTR